jgi:hypothetical protein
MAKLVLHGLCVVAGHRRGCGAAKSPCDWRKGKRPPCVGFLCALLSRAPLPGASFKPGKLQEEGRELALVA